MTDEQEQNMSKTQQTIGPGVIVGEYRDRIPAHWPAIDVEPLGSKRTRITVMPPDGEAITLAMLAPVLDAIAVRADEVTVTLTDGGERASIVVPKAHALRLAQRLWRLCG